ncbi:MAG: gliding motility protein GldM [Bacteroidetes bacterium]|nr:gliding motility protein GldM [Bacteroidota bacterium]
MALPKEPRQKMINIMYLVLTALLAINISAEILNAFKTINDSLEKTNGTVKVSSTQIFESLTEKMSEDATREKASIWQPKAKDVMDQSTSAFTFIENLKKDLIKQAGGDPNDPSKKYREDDQNMVTRVMIKEGKAKELYKILGDFKINVLKDSAIRAWELENPIPISLEMPKSMNSSKKSWEEAYFYMAPTVGALSILSKFQNDIRNAENKIVTYCHEQVGKVELRFDAFEAIVGQSSRYLMPGQELEITAGLGAFSRSKLPTVNIGGANVPLNEKGMAIYKTTASGTGSRTVNVTVSFTDQDGKPQTRTIPIEYTVGSANASIALDKMNVLYIGVDNPVSIAASGGGDDKIRAEISGGGGQLSRVGNGKYNCRVSQITDKCIISVYVDNKLAGASEFRVQALPPAQAYVGGKQSGEPVTAGEFRSQAGVGAGIINFPFKLEYSVVSYTFTCDTDDDIISIPVQGAAFSQAVRTAIGQHVRPGRMVTIEDIRVKGPDGRVNKAGALVYYIQ